MLEGPVTAPFPSMPRNTLERVDVDYISPLLEMGGLLSKLSLGERSAMEKDEPIQKTHIKITCPECRGPLWEERQGRIVEYRCRVGHAYNPRLLRRKQSKLR